MKENVEKKKITDKLIGVYDYTVILTYISLFISVIGMTQAMNGRFRTAVTCLALSGLCDMFDGKIARSKKNRTESGRLSGYGNCRSNCRNCRRENLLCDFLLGFI